MKLTKEEALTIIKVAAIASVQTGDQVLSDDLFEELTNLSIAAELMLLKEGERYEEAEDKRKDEKVPCCEACKEEVDESEEAQKVDELEGLHDCEVSASVLHNLKPVSIVAGYKLEFEELGSGLCEVLIDGYTEIRITHVRRTGNDITVREAGRDDVWTTYSVSKFPKDWIACLPVNKLVKVTA